MAKAYSNDLRHKFIEAHQQGEGSLAELARRFHVSVGWAKKVSATFSRSGSWERPPQSRYGRRSKFTPQVRLRLAEWIDEQPDLTLHELQSRLHAELGLKASIGRLWSLLHEMGLRFKKSRSTPPSRTVPRASEPSRSGKADFHGRKRRCHGNDPTLRSRAAGSPRARGSARWTLTSLLFSAIMKCTRPPGPLDCHSCHSPNSPKLRRYSTASARSCWAVA